MDVTRVLVVGYRSGLIRALQRAAIPFSIWSERAVKDPEGCLQLEVGPMGMKKDPIKAFVRRFAPRGPFSHVIAGTEAGVFAASVSRRVLGARLSVDSTVVRCRDKLLMKRFLSEHDVPMTDFCSAADVEDAAEVFARFGTPLVVKDRTRSGGRGLSFVDKPEDLPPALGRGRMVEKFVRAPELSMESFVEKGRILFTSITEYYEKGHVNVVPGGVSIELREQILALNQQVISALRIHWGMTHHEIYLTDKGPIFGEIALRPPGGYIMDCLHAAWGFDPWEAFLAIELGLEFAFPPVAEGIAAATILHPGAGKIVAIGGASEVAAHPATRACRLKVEVGEDVSVRRGTGEDVGHVLQFAGTRAELLEALSFLKQSLHFEMG